FCAKLLARIVLSGVALQEAANGAMIAPCLGEFRCCCPPPVRTKDLQDGGGARLGGCSTAGATSSAALAHGACLVRLSICAVKIIGFSCESQALSTGAR